MSDAVFPILSGLTWNVGKAPNFNSIVQRSVSGRELRMALMQYPLWTFNLSYEVLKGGTAGTDISTMIGFFLARKGQFDSFLYSDPSDNSVTAQTFGTGDGITKTFQIMRAIGGFSEPIQNLNGAPVLYDNGSVIASGYTLSNGLVTFAAAPAAGHALTWTGGFYYRVRFTKDSSEFNNFAQDLWDLKKLEFVGAPGNRV